MCHCNFNTTVTLNRIYEKIYIKKWPGSRFTKTQIISSTEKKKEKKKKKEKRKKEKKKKKMKKEEKKEEGLVDVEYYVLGIWSHWLPAAIRDFWQYNLILQKSIFLRRQLGHSLRVFVVYWYFCMIKFITRSVIEHVNVVTKFPKYPHCDPPPPPSPLPGSLSLSFPHRKLKRTLIFSDPFPENSLTFLVKRITVTTPCIKETIAWRVLIYNYPNTISEMTPGTTDDADGGPTCL